MILVIDVKMHDVEICNGSCPSHASYPSQFRHMWQLFGEETDGIIEELNEQLVA